MKTSAFAFIAATVFTLPTLLLSARGDTVSWNFGTSSGAATPSSSPIAYLTVGPVSQGNNNGTTTLLTTTSPSSGYSGFSGSYNAGAAARTGSLNTASAGSAYFEFTLTPSASYKFDLTEISFGTRSTSTGPQAYTIRTSADAYASDIATGAITNNSTWALKSNTGLTLSSQTALTFRVYGHNGTGSPGTNTANWRIDDLTLNVTVTSIGQDPDPPLATGYSPLNGATGVTLNANLAITFNEPVTAGTGNVVLKKTSDNSVVETFLATSGSISDKTVTFDPATPLTGSTGYYVEIDATAFKDAVNNFYAGITGSSTWAFTTMAGDSDPPAISSLKPGNTTTGILPTAKLVATFGENIFAGSGDIVLKKLSDGSIVQTFTVGGAGVTVSGTTLTLVPTSQLDFNTGYYVELATGVVVDGAANPNDPVSGSATWSFTTRPAPSVVISQYYEGVGSDRFIELKNLTGSPITLDGYRLTAWSNSDAGSGNEGWKSGTATTIRSTPLDGKIIPANGHFLVSRTGAAAPAYAVANNDLATGQDSVTSIDGDESIVLYSGTTNDLANVIDAVSFVSNIGTDTSFYRLNQLTGFDFDTGSSIANYSNVWGTKALADVASATTSDPWYLAATIEIQTLTLSIAPLSISENGGSATATVTRSGPTTSPLIVNISIPDTSEATANTTVEIPIGSASANFSISAVNDPWLDGNQSVTVTVSQDGFLPDSETLTVEDELTDTIPPLVINELDCDQALADSREFVEIYNKSAAPVSLDGISLVFFNGSTDLSYRAVNLSGHTIPANGFFVVGNPSVASVNVTFPNDNLQNGADAVALVMASPAQFPDGTPVAAATPAILVDALVYGTNDTPDTGLIDALTPGKTQVDEGNNPASETVSLSRIPDGGAAFDSSLFVTQVPTPGQSNVLPGYADWINDYPGVGALTGFGDDPDGDGIDNGTENYLGTAPDQASAGLTEPILFGNSLIFRHTRSNSIASDVSATYQWSKDLQTWYGDGVTDPFGTMVDFDPSVFTDNDAPANDVIEVYAILSGSSADRIFVRIVVSQAGPPP